MTNEEKIKNMSRSELAEFIMLVSCNATKISTCEERCDDCEYSEGYCMYQIGEWLMREVEE